MNCIFCSKICKNENSLRNHERLCKQNPNRQHIVSNLIEYNKKRKSLNIKGCNQYTKAAKLGLPKPTISNETREKISHANRSRPPLSAEQRAHKSKAMKEAVQNHPDSYSKNNVVGRVKNIEYNGVKLKGSWELLVAKWLDQHLIKWEHETRAFKYNWHGSRTYYPDFYLPDLDLFLEVKGYERERDREKWKVVPNLVVFKRKEIEDIKQNKALLSTLTTNRLNP